MAPLRHPVNSLDQSKLSPFTELVILETIFKDAIALRQKSSHNGCSDFQHLREQHNLLIEMLTSRVNAIVQNYSKRLQHSDPILLFSAMLAQALILYLCNSLESLPHETDKYPNTVAKARQKSLQTTREISSLSKFVAQVGYIKV